ncbi:MAG: HigA family addiction module antitoxin [Candidatus Brocadia sp.]
MNVRDGIVFALTINGVFVLGGVTVTQNRSKFIIKELSMAKHRIVPVHPGVYLKELLDELKISQYRLARDLGVPAMRISHVVHGKRPVTAELALRLGRYFSQSPRYWINLQSRYDMDIAEDLLSEQVAREVRPLTAVG